MTEQEKIQRRERMAERKAARDAQRARRDAEERADKSLMLEALRAVLRDPEATTEQKIFAVTVLDNVQHYSLVPYSVKHPGTDSDALIADFAKRLEAYQGKDK